MATRVGYCVECDHEIAFDDDTDRLPPHTAYDTETGKPFMCGGGGRVVSAELIGWQEDDVDG